MRSNWFPDGVGCIEENRGMTWLLRQLEPTELQEVQVQRLGHAPFFPRAQDQAQEGRARQDWGEVNDKRRAWVSQQV